MTLAIRNATPADVATVLRFVRELAEYEREPDAVVATEADLCVALFAPDAVASCVLAEVSGAPVGFALWFRNFSTWLGKPGLYLEDLYVTPSARGAGVGRALLRHLARIAVEHGFGRFEWSVLDWNEPAIRFYESLGSVAMDEWTVRRLSGDALARLAAED